MIFFFAFELSFMFRSTADAKNWIIEKKNEEKNENAAFFFCICMRVCLNVCACVCLCVCRNEMIYAYFFNTIFLIISFSV